MRRTVPGASFPSIARCRAIAWVLAMLACASAHAQGPVVPGTGQVVEDVGDDFEDPDWSYVFNNPKSSSEQDEQTRPPLGYSRNGRWVESPLRGHPDVVQRVATPPGGLPGSQGALLLQTLRGNIPGRTSQGNGQDDLLARTSRRYGQIPVSWSPNFVVRVYLPPFEEWEPRTGTSFGIRAGVFGQRTKQSEGLLGIISGPQTVTEEYWPGFFIMFNSAANRRGGSDSAYLLIRSDGRGRDVRGPEIHEPGWWTFGMSFTPDGQVHFYARPGVEDLTAEDHLYSAYCYGFRCQRFQTFFFDVISRDDGRSWSTPWVIDDPALYILPPATVRDVPRPNAAPPLRR